MSARKCVIDLSKPRLPSVGSHDLPAGAQANGWQAGSRLTPHDQARTLPTAVPIRALAHLLLSWLLVFLVIGCNSNTRTEDPGQWSEAQAAEWFDEKEWLGQTELQPDASIDKKEFAIRYHRHKDRWDKAFAFLADKDLSALETGTHEIDGKDLYAIVSEYNSKNPEDAQYESHKIYTDLQYVVFGTEYIGLTDLSSTSVITPYHEEKEIAFYNASAGRKIIAKPGTFFIFFPDDAHRPGMKVDENAPVKKIVIKVRN